MRYLHGVNCFIDEPFLTLTYIINVSSVPQLVVLTAIFWLLTYCGCHIADSS